MTDAIPSVTVKNGLGNKEEKFKHINILHVV